MYKFFSVGFNYMFECATSISKKVWIMEMFYLLVLAAPQINGAVYIRMGLLENDTMYD
jgi:hypothetical protein